jgi:hypothetical protein
MTPTLADQVRTILHDAIQETITGVYDRDDAVAQIMMEMGPLLEAAQEMRARLKHFESVQRITMGDCHRYDAAVARIMGDQ